MNAIKKNILVVDDSELDRTLLSIAISKKSDFNILQAKDGNECLKILESEDVHLVLLDFVMPELDGPDTLREIRKRYNTVELPVIMVTSKSESSDVVKCLQNGANDYITKPVTFDVAISRISTHLRISDLSAEMAKVKEIYALNALVTTYNHEINNPLTIAISCVDFKNLSDPETKRTLSESLWRISSIVKKIQEVTSHEIEIENYSKNVNMISLKHSSKASDKK